MKRSEGTRRFRTLGSRMRAFGRSLMRHYVPPQDMPSLDGSQPGWQSAAETPLLWPDAPALDVGAVADEAEIFDAPEERAPDAAPRPRPARPAPAAPPPPQAPVQRKPAPSNSKVNPVLFDMLAKHDAREAERQRIREEKKSAFDAAEVQRQADPDAPPVRRRGRMSVDYVETSSLAQGDDAPPRPTKAPSPPDTAEAAPIDTIQPERDTPTVQRQPTRDDGDAADDYAPYDGNDFPDNPQDWDDNDGGDDGRPPRIDPAPAPPSAPGMAQRAPQDTGTFEGDYEGDVEDDSDYSDSDTFQDVSAAPIADMRRPMQQSIQREYQPDPPDLPAADDGDAAYFTADDEAASDYADEPPASYVSDPSPSQPIQREYRPAAPDVQAETTYFEQPDFEDAAAYDLPTFAGDEGDTRPMPVRRAPVLPPPTLSDESQDVAPATETGYHTLSDWVDAHTDAATPTAPSAVQRDTQAPTADDGGAGDAAAFDGDDGDTRPIAAQRVYQPPAPEFEADAAFEPPEAVADEPVYNQAPEADTDETFQAEDRGEFSDEAAEANVSDNDFDAQGDESALTYDADDSDFNPPEQRLDTLPISASAPPNVTQRQFNAPEADYGETFEVEKDGEFEGEAAEYAAPIYDDNDEADYSEFNAAGASVDSPIAAPTNDVQRQPAAPEATYAETFEVEEGGEIEAEAVEYAAPIYDDRDEADYSDFNAVETGVDSPIAAPTNDVQRQPAAPEATYAETFEVEEGGDFVDEAVEYDAPIYDDSGETDYNDFSAIETGGDAPVAAPTNTVQRQSAAPEASRDQTAEVEAGGEFKEEAADTAAPLYDSSYEAEYVDFIPAARNLDGTFSTSEPDIAQRTDQPPTSESRSPTAPTPFYGDDVYETDISALLGGQPDPRPIQRRAELPPPDADNSIETGYDGGDPSVDLYQAMMGAGMIAPDEADTPDFGFDNSISAAPPTNVQRGPDDDALEQPLDLFQAMMETGMVQPARDDFAAADAPDMDYPAEVDEPMSAALKADLLSFLDAPAAPRPSVSQPPAGENIVSRVYEPPQPQVVQRVETDEPAQEPQKDADIDVDQLARDVYSKLRSRLRIERERRDHKP